MRRTTAVDLFRPFVAVAAIAYVLLRAFYGSLPPVGYGIAAPLVFLAVIEFLAARRVRAAISHHPEAKAMPAIMIARLVALGKASALVSAGLMGALGALILRVLPDVGRIHAATSDLRAGIVLLTVSAVLLTAGVVLERSGVDPGRPDDRRPGPPAAAA